MAISAKFNFAPGVTVTIVTTGPTFTGELINEVDNFLIIRLTVGTTPFSAGQVIRINTNRIVALG
ncbi:hypothetical protein Dtox_3537 [Desulfofarcimen acetoxidans DSM 771]|uniref:Uncharacterized protein n=1 Tax=Desulfofarcimen acetoxidans (strain ATCC 49208 / DSM 771 / KCTC 5769 / VKM B-1644 / 5575) TaxID=485916 RepID=C8VVW6_DESAS|nr:hypothetical protein [Desulfofarcimen acetoxidans]ACV64253.1 hypothetical protein Dtox_3537 [Desulfofarcimen acetoxidans DSM 771]